MIKEYSLKNTRPVISFTFDDFPSTAMNAAQMLSEAQISATFYASMGNMGADGYFSDTQLEWLVSNNHEIGCHTFSHKSLRLRSKRFLREEVERNRESFNKIIPGEQLSNFAYPYGIQTLFGRTIIRENFKSARGTRHGINYQRSDLFNLKAVKLYENLHSPEKIMNFLRKTGELNGWIIFYTHSVEKKFDKYSCSPRYFNKILQFSIDTGFEILPVSEVVNAHIVKNKSE